MSEPQISDPVVQPNGLGSSPGEPTEDPLLGSDSVIDAEKPEPGTESPEHKSTPDAGLGQSVPIAAEPISMLRPGEDSVEAPPRSAARRRDPEEMSKRPDWLPEEWKIDLRVRSSGATAGLIDRYFIAPSGQGRFRSKNEVLKFLETGSSKKRKSVSEGDAEPSESPMSSPKKSRKKGKKSEDVPKKSEDVDKSSGSSSKKRKKDKKSEDVAKKSRKNGEKSKGVPETSEDAVNESEDAHEKSEDVFDEPEDVPEKCEDVPDKSEDVLEKPKDVPEASEDVPNGVDAEADE